MTKIKKLEIVIKEWEDKATDLFKESVFARNHNEQVFMKVRYFIGAVHP